MDFFERQAEYQRQKQRDCRLSHKPGTHNRQCKCGKVILAENFQQHYTQSPTGVSH